MNAFVAITDRDWFDFLAAREDVDEVNFWQPSAGGGRFRALGRGEPFLFKLRAPVNAIVGGGWSDPAPARRRLGQSHWLARNATSSCLWLAFPRSRPMSSIGPRCHELRIPDGRRAWRIIYRIDADAVIIGGVFEKKSQRTPRRVIGACRRRFKEYDEIVRGE